VFYLAAIGYFLIKNLSVL